jgi:hypothetical protein
VKEIGAHIIGGFVDVSIVTHEHQDHVNGLTSENFPGLKVGKVWFAWTENPTDDIANQLRKKFKDRLLGMIDTRDKLILAILVGRQVPRRGHRGHGGGSAGTHRTLQGWPSRQPQCGDEG